MPHDEAAHCYLSDIMDVIFIFLLLLFAHLLCGLLLPEHIFHVVSHLIPGSHFFCSVNNKILLFFRKLCKLVQDVRVLCQLHCKSDWKFLVVYHNYHLIISIPRDSGVYTGDFCSSGYKTEKYS